MKTKKRNDRAKQRMRPYFIAAWILCFPFSNRTGAEIVRTMATVSATSQELMNGVPASVTSDANDLLPDASNLPLSASAELTSTDLGGELIAMGAATASFNDPTRLDQPNPEEFAIEAACYSNDLGVSYAVGSTAIETRTVRFTADEIDFASGATQTVQSRIFLSGAVVVWTIGDKLDLSQIDGQVTVSVTRDGNETLFETSLTVAPGSNGDLETNVTGAISSTTVSVADLVSLGLDGASRDVLESVENAGTLLLLILPQQEHTYAYSVEQDREYDLTARLAVTLTNAPGQTGMAAVLGRPFSNIASFVETGLTGTNGGSVQAALNKAIAQQDIPDDSGSPAEGNSPQSTTTPSLCGALGVEALAVFAPFALVSRRRKRAA